jgi:hypothetical protein
VSTAHRESNEEEIRQVLTFMQPTLGYLIPAPAPPPPPFHRRQAALLHDLLPTVRTRL